MQNTRILIPLLLIVAAILSACPSQKTPQVVETSRRTTPSNVDVNVNVNDETGSTETAVVPRPKPTSDIYVYVPLERYHTSEPFEAEYKYTGSPDDKGKIYVDVIPEGGADEQRAASTDPAMHYELSSPQSTVKIAAPAEGRYRVRMSRDTGSSVEVLSESDPFEVIRWPSGDLTARRAPYVTITPEGGTTISTVKIGEPVKANFQVPAGFPDDAWITVVPADTPDAVVDTSKIPMSRLSDLQDQTFVWNADTGGNYVFRVYPSLGSSYYVAQSEPFMVDGAGATGNAPADTAENPPVGNDSGDRDGNDNGDRNGNAPGK